MNQTSMLKERIKSFLSRELYKSNDENISIFDLISNVIANNQKMKNELTTECCLENVLEKVEYESKQKYLYLCYYSREKEYLKIMVDKYRKGRFQQRTSIIKSIKGDKISSNNNRFLKRYYNEIEKSFSILKKYQYLFSEDNTIEVMDDVFSISMYFNPSIGINSDIYISYNNRRVWLTKELLSNVDDYKSEIFKRVHVPVSKLPELYKRVLDVSIDDKLEKTKKLK